MRRFVVVELGAGDPRPLLRAGAFAVEMASATTIAEFVSADAARTAGERATNRRPGATLYVPNADKLPARITADGREICAECAGRGYVGDGDLCVCEGSGVMPVPGELDREDIEGRCGAVGRGSAWQG